MLILCGAKVAQAFGFKSEPYHIYRGPEFRIELVTVPFGNAPTFVTLPHPSGLNRAWHQVGAIERARVVLREVGVLVRVEPNRDYWQREVD